VLKIPVRAMQLKDISRIATLSEQLGYLVSIQDLEYRFHEIVKHPNDGLFVAVKNEEVVGWVHVYPTHLLETEPYAEIGGLVVDQNARRLGVGRALVDAAIGWTRERNLKILRVRSNVARKEAHHFYPGVGFERIKSQHVYSMNV
jgi:GNAT superfamily N-acetyltransferase